MKENKIKFAVVGCGHIGKRHAEMVTRDQDAELVALCDIRPREELGIEAYEVPFFAGLQELLQSGIQIDVINICTPNGLHASMAVQAIEAGCNVVIEKPMALTLADAEKVVYASLKYRKQVFCVMQNRYSPPSVWIKDMIDSGKLGEIYMVQLNCYWNRDERYYKPGGWHGDAALDGGTLFTQFSHFIDIMYWLFGDICNIQARFADFNHEKLTAFEDSGFVNFNFVNGGMGSLSYSTSVWDKNMESSMLIVAENGSVKIGGYDVKDYTLESLMEQISVVFQNVYLFSDTIENNIKFGKPEATHDEVVAAAKAACCDDFIGSLPDGYQAVIGEGGASLSGGEKQRISIARAIMKDAPIIILDEATANVDPESEQELTAAIEALTKEKTIMMIAHRLKTVRHADNILVIDGGKIVQSGTHEQLMQQGGIYRRFVESRELAVGWKV